MKFKASIVSLMVLFVLNGCSETSTPEEPENKVHNAFYIEQDNKRLIGDVISLQKAPFRIVSETKGFSIVVAQNPIRNLADHKEIVKLTGTTGAWYLGQVPFYQRSDLLSDRHACLAYYGNEGAGCQEYIQEKARLGFKLHYAYTFAEYQVLKSSVTLLGMGGKSMENLASGKYYLYLFKSEHPMGKVAHSQHVQRITLDLQ